MDRIHIHSISCLAHVGVAAEERESAQEVLVDLVLSIDLEPAANIDAVELTVDYQQMVHKVQETSQQNRYRLLESLAAQLCRVILEDDRIAAVQLTVHKFPEILREKVKSVAVEMTRTNG